MCLTLLITFTYNAFFSSLLGRDLKNITFQKLIPNSVFCRIVITHIFISCSLIAVCLSRVCLKSTINKNLLFSCAELDKDSADYFSSYKGYPVKSNCLISVSLRATKTINRLI